ncbi:YifB family Mg chelatase-like AAA ATPase [Thiomicrorhabdus sediminis]|uniref:ATP-binding protein n=1 Tax=Thiomicrorhabdus sediminis TaxID=2580412 RepID=A0A4P9K3C2_9GAMM|nr:YifB family Mg chelatase-like AAA ATPase [Thiomicrorhabdus sediminis]QCU89328.1 ATP-binding protein [Thiomicrorhabdus sediminis]
MAFAQLQCRALVGMGSPEVAVEVHASNGLPSFSIVGLPETSVKESKERVRSALLNVGLQIPPKRITVNLAPADLPKSGGRFDLVIALALLLATEQVNVSNAACCYECYGELALNGEIRPIQGLLPSLLAAKSSSSLLIVPKANSDEVELFIHSYPQLKDRVFVVENLLQACQVLSGDLEPLAKLSVQAKQPSEPPGTKDFADIFGQLQAKRALEVCASGHHSLLMVGPPGAGKSLLASALISILPALQQDEAIELASIKSLLGQQIDMNGFYQRPFVQPHHTASAASLVGGGTVPKPGALSLAHKGVLFLDELPEFNRQVLEALREPLETKQVNISRVNQHVSYPADNLLVCAMNPSPSGFFPDDALGRCKDTPEQIIRYQKRVSGPLLDRIDLHLQVPAMEIKTLHQKADQSNESSRQIRHRVTQARQRQLARQGCYNSQLDIKQLAEYAEINQPSKHLLEKAGLELGLSARGYHRIIRIARTLADMQEQADIDIVHIAEALSFRSQMS